MITIIVLLVLSVSFGVFGWIFLGDIETNTNARERDSGS